MPQIQMITLHIKENLMKKILFIIFLLIVFSTVTGCKQEDLVDENIALKAKIAVLEQQLKICKGETVKSNEDLFRIHPNATNPNDNASY